MPSPPARTIFRQLLDHVVVTRPGGGRLVQLGERAALIVLPDGSALFVMAPHDTEGMRERLIDLRKSLRARTLRVVVISDDPGVPEQLSGAIPAVQFNRRMHGFQLHTSGERWATSTAVAGEALDAAMDAVAAHPGALFPPIEAWEERMNQSLAHARQASGELDAFRRALNARRPYATWGLLLLIGVAYLATEWWGGPDQPQLLVRMGGILPASYTMQQPWRLLSGALLHGGLVHVAMNGFVLWSLGKFMEPLLGTSRFLVLFVIGALGGSLAAAYFGGDGVTIGASGALWGLLGAAGWLSFRPNGVIPEPLIGPLRRVSIQNLMLNIVISMFPGISMAGHFGGGLAGALLAATGWLGRQAAGAPDQADPPRALALIAALALVASLVVAWVVGQPWLAAG